MQTAIETITPEVAAELLTRNGVNRPLSRSTVNQYAKDIEAGRWHLSHQGIAIDKRGMLLDGQHRLAAILQSGRPIDVLVSRDLEPEVFAVLDCGRKRSLADAIALAGAPSPQLAKTVASGVRLYMLCSKYPASIWGSMSVVSVEEILEQYLRAKSHWEDMAKLAHSRKMPRIIIAGPMTCALAWASDFYVGQGGQDSRFIRFESFLSDLYQGANLPNSSPVLSYRNRCALSSAPVPQQNRVYDYIKLFSYWLEGKPASRWYSPSLACVPDLSPWS